MNRAWTSSDRLRYEGIIDRIMLGMFLDVTGRKEAEEARQMLADEMSHRIKNLFAIASSLTSLAARSAATTLEMEHDLQRRLLTLSRAQNLIRPHPGEGGPSARLGELFEVLLSPCDDQAALGSRIHVAVPDVRVGETATTVVALVVQELATNSVKYGSLSAASGSLSLLCAEHNGEIVIVWTERDGPPVAGPPVVVGFGSKLVAQGVSRQLGGSIAYDWLPEGVVVTLCMSKARLKA